LSEKGKMEGGQAENEKTLASFRAIFKEINLYFKFVMFENINI